jgi:PX domain
LTQHRYSDFEKLDKILVKLSPLPCQLPPKLNFFADATKLVERKHALELYMESILYSKNTAFRRSEEWMDFIQIPESVRKFTPESGIERYSTAMQEKLNPERWLDEYAQLTRYLMEIRRCLNSRDEYGARNDMKAYQSAKLEARKALRIAFAEQERLETYLGQNTTSYDPDGLSKAEVTRRLDLVENTKIELVKLEEDCSAMKEIKAEKRKELFGMNAGVKSTRKFGVHETEQTRALNNVSSPNFSKSCCSYRRRLSANRIKFLKVCLELCNDRSRLGWQSPTSLTFRIIC